MTPPRLQLTHITKTYPGVVANADVSLSVQPGEIHAILGENGAGKSTLMKMIYGMATPDSGSMVFDGQPVCITSPLQARALGIAMVFQHFSLFETLTVAENVWLGLDKTWSLAQVTQKIHEKARAYGLDMDPQRMVHSLSVGEKQRVEIIRALLTDPHLLILDEPTSVLTPQAVQDLFVVLRQLATEGCSILYISHKLHEIRTLCTGCTVLRAGRVTGECNPQQESNASLSRMMIGSEPARLHKRGAAAGDVMLTVRGLNLPAEDEFAMPLQDIHLQVRAGEVLGVAGISGNGQRELLAALSGEDLRVPPHTLWLRGEDMARWSPARRRAAGLHYVPEERLGRGVVPGLSLAENLLLTRTEAVTRHSWIRRKALEAQASRIVQRFGVKAHSVHTAAKSLSGGNLQKFIVGREIDAHPVVFIAAQPTWGVDVGAQAQIHAEILQLRDAGCAVLLVSEEIEELFILSDRLVVLARGRLSPSVDVESATVEQLGEWMSGLWEQTPQTTPDGTPPDNDAGTPQTATQADSDKQQGAHTC